MVEMEKIRAGKPPFDKDPEVLKVYDEAGQALKKKEVFEKEFD